MTAGTDREVAGAPFLPSREIDADIGRALGWRVSEDPWWNVNKDGSESAPGDELCIRRDGRKDVACNEALPPFTFMYVYRFREPHRFPEISCSSCGRSFGPGNHGYSHCFNHEADAIIRAALSKARG